MARRHGHRSGRRPHTARGTSPARLLLPGLLLVAGALWLAPGLGGGHSHGADPPDAPPQDGRAGTDPEGNTADAGAGSTGGTADVPRAPDPTGDAYRAVRAGDCLTSDGPDAGDGAASPRRVGCAAAEAFHRVTGGADAPDGCPTGAGLSTWYHTSADGTTTALCLERVFRADQCFAALRVPATDAARRPVPGEPPDMADADLRTPLSCGADTVPEPFNTVLRITDVRDAALRDTESDRPSCGDGVEDRWYWIANRGTVLVCATVVDRGATP